MKKKVYGRWLILLSGILFSQFATAQVPQQLKQQLSGKKKLSEIMTIVEGYYRQHPDEADREVGGKEAEGPLYFWERWALEMSSRLNENGELTDISGKNLDAIRQLDSRVSPNNPTVSYGLWSELGPSSTYYGAYSGRGLGRVDRVAFDPSNANVLYAGTTAGGLFKTTNGGTSWSPISEYLPGLGISGIVASSASTLYVLTGDGDSFFSGWASTGTGIGFVEGFGYIRKSQGVWKTTDGGTTWSQTGDLATPGTYVGFRLVQDPSNSNVLLAATSAGLYRTTNGGTSWTQVISGLVGDVVFQPGVGSTRAYAAGEGWIKYSTDEGATWSGTPTFDFALPSLNKISLAIAPSNSSVVYAYCGNSGFSTFSGIYKSTNSGVNFTRQCTTPNINNGNSNGTDVGSNGSYSLWITVLPTNPTHINTCCTITWRSTNSGVTMVNTTNYWEDPGTGVDLPSYVHPDVHCIEYNPLDNNLYVGCDGGVWKSTDEGVTWTDISTGISAAQLYHMNATTGNVDNLLCGMQDNGVNYRNGATSSFRHVASGDGYSVIIDPSVAGAGYCSINKSVYEITSSLTSLSGISPTSGEWYGNLMINPTNSDMVFAGFSDVHKSSNRGGAWSNKGAAGNWCMTACPSNSSRYYAGGGTAPWVTSGNLYRSDDIGETWTIISNAASFPAAAGRPKITHVAVNPTNSLNVWCTFGGFTDGTKVYYSSDGGVNWVNRSGTLPNVAVNSIVIDNSNNAYAGTDVGVFYRGSGMSDWVPFYNYLPKVPVTDMIINTTSSVLTISTFGRGIWRSDVYSTCPASLAIGWSINSDRYYEASSDITGTNIISGNTDGATRVFFKAGSYITLNPGFEVKAGNEFKAYLGSCGSGNPVFRPANLNEKDKENLEVTLNNRDASKTAVITQTGTNNKRIELKFKTSEAGTVQFLLTDTKMNAVLKSGIANAEKGSFSESIPVLDIKPGMYYLHIIFNGSISHYQEVEIK